MEKKTAFVDCFFLTLYIIYTKIFTEGEIVLGKSYIGSKNKEIYNYEKILGTHLDMHIALGLGSA